MIDMTTNVQALSRGCKQISRQGERLISGAAMGVMTSAEATNLHTLADVGSLQLVNSMSDTYDVNDEYSGPGIALQRWVRSQDQGQAQITLNKCSI